jgi:hypothetical protein
MSFGVSTTSIISASNGLNVTNQDVKLGGTINGNPNIDMNSGELTFQGNTHNLRIDGEGIMLDAGTVADYMPVLVFTDAPGPGASVLSIFDLRNGQTYNVTATKL